MPVIEHGEQGNCPDCNALGECTSECRPVDRLPVIKHAPPGEFVDDDFCIVAIRIDGPEDTRGKARAFFASEAGEPFTSIKVRRTAYRYWQEHADECEADGIPEPYDGWPWIECGPGEHGHPYWRLVDDAR